MNWYAKMILMCFLTIQGVFSFDTHVEGNLHTHLQSRLDSLEYSLQESRRSGTYDKKINGEIAKLHRSLDELKEKSPEQFLSKKDNLAISKEEVSPAVSKPYRLLQFIQTHSILDVVIVAVGGITILVGLFLLCMLSFLKIKRKVKTFPPHKRRVVPKKDIIARLKEKMTHDVDQQSKSDNVAHKRVPSSFEESSLHPTIETHSTLLVVPPYVSSDSVYPQYPSSSKNLPVDPELLVSHEPPLYKKFHTKTTQATMIRDEIVRAYDLGETVIEIAQNKEMSVDQVNLILRLAGRS